MAKRISRRTNKLNCRIITIELAGGMGQVAEGPEGRGRMQPTSQLSIQQSTGNPATPAPWQRLLLQLHQDTPQAKQRFVTV